MQTPEPYVPASKSPTEITITALIAGAVFGVLFGFANAYLGLRVGLTISTSIPIAVMAVAFFGALSKFGRPSSILEANIVQTMGSASSSQVSGLIFTVPALYMWGLNPSLHQIGLLALLGGVLGVLFMIPLRPFLIVKEHNELPYPEGTAAAAILKAADQGGASAKGVVWGLGIGAAHKVCTSFGKLWSGGLETEVPVLPKGHLSLEASPALLGVGYILGYRTSAIMVGGSLLASLVLIPVIGHFGAPLTEPLFPVAADGPIIAAMSAKEIWSKYVRYIGAGAVAVAGLMTVLQALPMLYSSLVAGFAGLRDADSEKGSSLRTERDLPLKVTLIGAGIVGLVCAVSNQVLGSGAGTLARVIGSVLILFFAFLFVVVSSRIVGLVGVTSNPTSGMTIVTLLGTAGVFAALGWTDMAAKATVLTIGTVVCVAASIAGDTSQDLKTGYLLGATPARQQSVEIAGAVAAAFFVAAAVHMLGAAFEFGSAELPAPQATLMKTVIDGVLGGNLPWGLVLMGGGIALVVGLLGIPALPFAVGVYLPLASLSPIFVGGCMRALVEMREKKAERDSEIATSKGVLVASGLVAGEGLVGVAVAIYALSTKEMPGGWIGDLPLHMGEIIAAAIFIALCFWLIRVSRPESAPA